jgi:hypothetical protein
MRIEILLLAAISKCTRTCSPAQVARGLGDHSLNRDRVMYQLSNGGDLLT